MMKKQTNEGSRQVAVFCVVKVNKFSVFKACFKFSFKMTEEEAVSYIFNAY